MNWLLWFIIASITAGIIAHFITKNMEDGKKSANVQSLISAVLGIILIVFWLFNQ